MEKVDSRTGQEIHKIILEHRELAEDKEGLPLKLTPQRKPPTTMWTRQTEVCAKQNF